MINLYLYLICYSLAKEEELIAAKNKSEELEKENSNISSVLAKKEQELDLRNQEKVIINTILFLINLLVL